MATLQELERAFVKADDAGNTEDAAAFAAEIRRMRGEQAKAPKQEKNWGDVASGAVKNFIPSTANLFKGVYEAISDPPKTIGNLLDVGAGAIQNALPTSLVNAVNTALPAQRQAAEEAQAKASAMGDFYKGRYGSMEGFKEALATDPAGVLSDASLLATGGGAALAKVPTMAQAGKAVGQVGKVIDPFRISVKGAEAALKTGGKAASEVIGGIGTHTGGESIRQAAAAGFAGGQKAKEFAQNMRGDVPITDILDDANSALEAMRANRAAEYRAGMQGVKGNTSVLKFNDIDTAVTKALGVKQFKGKSISPTTSDVQAKLVSVVDDWKNSNPADFHTAEGFDALKQAIGDIRDSTKYGTPERLVADGVYNAVKKEIVSQAPDYARVMADYAKASDTIAEVRRTLLGNEKGSVNSALNKLQSLMSATQKSKEYPLSLAKQLEKSGAPNLLSNIAGQSLQGLAPRGLAGQAGIGLGGLSILYGNPGVGIPFLAMQSPRLMGELALRTGQGAGVVSRAIGAGRGMVGPLRGAPVGNVLSQMSRIEQEAERRKQRGLLDTE